MLKVIAVVLAVLLALCLLAMFFLDVEYTDTGVRVRFPWTQVEPSRAPEMTNPVVIVTQKPTAPPTAAPEKVGAVAVTAAQLLDGTAAQTVADAGGNALVVEMKGADGRLAWNSEEELAAALGVNAGEGDLSTAVSQLARAGELHLVARLSCFRDQALADNQVGGPLTTQGGNVWYDAWGLRWVSPVSERVRDYLVGLCRELADMGFDEILLECAGFPDRGETAVLATSENRPTDLTGPVEQFLAQVEAALADSGTELSLRTSWQTVLGEETLSGLTPAALARYAQRVWLTLPEQGGQALAAALEAAGMERAQERLVALGGRQTDFGWTTLDDAH